MNIFTDTTWISTKRIQKIKRYEVITRRYNMMFFMLYMKSHDYNWVGLQLYAALYQSKYPVNSWLLRRDHSSEIWEENINMIRFNTMRLKQ